MVRDWCGSTVRFRAATSSVTGTTILYVPVAQGVNIFYEPMYQFTGRTSSGGMFYIYIPAIDPAYLR